MSYWVVTEEHDPGNSYDTFEEARAVVVTLQKNGFPNACILSEETGWVPSWDRNDEYNHYTPGL
jgi:hypothetical protein